MVDILPVKEISGILIEHVAEDLQALSLTDIARGLEEEIQTAKEIVLNVAVVLLVAELCRQPEIAGPDRLGMNDRSALEEPFLRGPAPFRDGRLLVEPAVYLHGSVVRVDVVLRYHVDDAAECTRPVQGRAGALYDFHVIYLRNRNRFPDGLPGVSGQ